MIVKRLLIFLLLFTLLIFHGCFHESSEGVCDEENEMYIKVYQYDQSVQCGPQSGISLSIMQQQLIDAGIDVICAEKGYDGMNYAAVCGGTTGNINVFTINRSSLVDVENLGFHPISELEHYQPAD